MNVLLFWLALVPQWGGDSQRRSGLGCPVLVLGRLEAPLVDVWCAVEAGDVLAGLGAG